MPGDTEGPGALHRRAEDYPREWRCSGFQWRIEVGVPWNTLCTTWHKTSRGESSGDERRAQRPPSFAQRCYHHASVDKRGHKYHSLVDLDFSIDFGFFHRFGLLHRFGLSGRFELLERNKDLTL